MTKKNTNTTLFIVYAISIASCGDNGSKETPESSENKNLEQTSISSKPMIENYINDETFYFYHLCNRFDEFGDSKIIISGLYDVSKIKFYGYKRAVNIATKSGGDVKFEKRISINEDTICIIDESGMKKGVKQYFVVTIEDYGLRLLSADTSILNSKKRFGDFGTIDVGFILSKDKNLKLATESE